MNFLYVIKTASNLGKKNILKNAKAFFYLWVYSDFPLCFRVRLFGEHPGTDSVFFLLQCYMMIVELFWITLYKIGQNQILLVDDIALITIYYNFPFSFMNFLNASAKLVKKSLKKQSFINYYYLYIQLQCYQLFASLHCTGRLILWTILKG